MKQSTEFYEVDPGSKFPFEGPTIVPLGFGLGFSEQSKLIIYFLFFCFSICRPFCIDGALLAKKSWAQIYVETIDSSDSVIDWEVLWRFCNFCWVAVAFVVVVICSGIADGIWTNCVCGAGTFSFLGIFGMRTRKTGNTFESTDETQQDLSEKRHCFIFLSTSIFLCASRACLNLSFGR